MSEHDVTDVREPCHAGEYKGKVPAEHDLCLQYVVAGVATAGQQTGRMVAIIRSSKDADVLVGDASNHNLQGLVTATCIDWQPGQ